MRWERVDFHLYGATKRAGAATVSRLGVGAPSEVRSPLVGRHEKMNDGDGGVTEQRQKAERLHIPAIRRHIFLCCDQTVPKCSAKER